jgi:hypothetical protein
MTILEVNTEEMFQNTGMGTDFLDIFQVHRKQNKQYYIELKSLIKKGA